MNNLPQQIGCLIRKQRSDKKNSQEKLALLRNIDRSYVGRIERGEVNITVIKISEIASVLKVSPKDLLPDL